MTGQPPGWDQQPGWAPLPAPKPGVIPLGPLGLGEILEGAISYIRANPKVTLGLSAVVMTLTQLVQVPGQYLYYSSLARRLAQPGFYPGAPTTDVAGELGGGLAFLLGIAVSLVAVTLLAGILIVVMSRAVLGWRTDLRQAWTAVQPRLLGLLVDALRRSRRLVDQTWWRVFGILLLITAVFVSIAATITTPFTVGVTCLLYVDQRIRREAWNLELARAAYGKPPEAGPQLDPSW